MAKMYFGSTEMSPVFIREEKVVEKVLDQNIHQVLGNINGDGKLERDETPIIINGEGIKELGDYALTGKYYRDSRVKEIYFDDIQQLTGYAALSNFNFSGGCEKVSFKKLTTISGDFACYHMFYMNDASAGIPVITNNKLELVDLSSLITILISGNSGLFNLSII